MADKKINIHLAASADLKAVNAANVALVQMARASDRTSKTMSAAASRANAAFTEIGNDADKAAARHVRSAKEIEEAWKKAWRNIGAKPQTAEKSVAPLVDAHQKAARKAGVSWREEFTRGAIWKVAADTVSRVFSGVAGTIKSAFASALHFETQTIQFKTLVGDIDEAKAHMADLKALGDTPPFSLDQFAKASRALMVMTDGVLGYRKSLELLGDAAAATGHPIETMAQAVGYLYASIRDGQPLSRAVMQLRHMGVITPEVAQKLQDLQAAGASNAEIWAEVESQLSRYKGAMAETEKTGEGLVGAIKTRWDNIVRAFGNALMKDAKGGLDAVNKAAKDLEESGDVEVWANKVVGALRSIREAASDCASALGWIWEKSGLSDVYAVGKATLQGAAYATTRAVAGWASGEGFTEALAEAGKGGGDMFGKAMAEGHWLGKMADNGWLGRGMKWAADDNKKDAAYEAEQEEEIRNRARESGRREEAKSAEREAMEKKRIEDNLAEAQKKKDEEREAAAAEAAAKEAAKAAEERQKAEIAAAKAAAQERERLDRELHQKRMNDLREEIEAQSKAQAGQSAIRSAAQTEFERAFAMYRDPSRAASEIAEERDRADDLDSLHRDARRYGGKWRIDELASLMSAGDSQGVSDRLAEWRKSSKFSPEVEAMVRASAAEKTRDLAEERMQQIADTVREMSELQKEASGQAAQTAQSARDTAENTRDLAAKIDTLLKVKG